jgi:hypothetical protein
VKSPLCRHAADEAESPRGRIVEFGALHIVISRRPAVIKTRPSGRRVAACAHRACIILPEAVKLPVEGSYSSA